VCNAPRGDSARYLSTFEGAASFCGLVASLVASLEGRDPCACRRAVGYPGALMADPG
jgi:hypothetical protein